MNPSFTFRYADEQDIPEIIRLIKELAIYERAEESAVATPELLTEWLFEKKAAEALLINHPIDGVVGCAIFFQNFSTWTGRGGMYLEDLYIEERHRGSGAGRAVMAELARICRERGWVRLDWSCLDWNTPSLGFYERIGAEQMTEWVHHRLSGDALDVLADSALADGAPSDSAPSDSALPVDGASADNALTADVLAGDALPDVVLAAGALRGRM